MIEICDLNKSFGKLNVLKNVNLSFNKGECIALLGPNGCGKTTLIKSILGMVIPSSGKIKVDGNEVGKSYEYRNNIGYMPQIGRYPENMMIGQVIEMLKDLRVANGELDESLIHDFKLSSLSKKRMGTLSGGTTQKVSACLAFLFNPQILILDEPTAGLDPIASETFKEKIIAEKNKGKLIIITSHLLSELDDLVTQIVFMQEGNILFHKTIEELKQDTGQSRLSTAIANVLKNNIHEPNY